MKKRKDFFNNFLDNLPYKSITAVVLVLLLVLPLLQVPLFSPNVATVQAATGDFSIDWVAANPYSYDHSSGGGAYDDRTIGLEYDVVESLQGGDFACDDIVTYFAVVTVDDTASADTDAPQTIEMEFSFLADTTGQSGVAIGDIVKVQVNYDPIEDLITGEDNIDQGIIDNGDSTATLKPGSEYLTGPLFQSGSELRGTVVLNGLERAEQVVVRIDVRLFCDPGSDPTGNLAGDLKNAYLTYINGGIPVDPPEAISGGAQTIPFNKVSQILFYELNMFKSVSLDGSCPGAETQLVPINTIVYYCYEVYNNGNTDLYDFTLTDDQLGDVNIDLLEGFADLDGDGVDDDLALGSSADNYANPLQHEAIADITNIAEAVGYTDQGEPISDSAFCIVEVFDPTAVTLTDFAASSNGGVPAGLLIAAGLLGIALLAFYVIRSRRIHLNGT